MFNYLKTLLILVAALFAFSQSAQAGKTCADLDGDGIAETCIETD